MSTNPRRRYRVRLRRAVAGSFLAAAAAASVAGLAAAPALAVPPAVVAGVDSSDFSDSFDYEARNLILGLRPGSSPNAASTVTVGGEPSSADRLAGVRADLDRAVLLRMVTPEQADGFYAQIERRVAAGL
ncbi:hypothetical protein [Arthrobacter burdickii]|uniref:Uncharacterized protein n=1 Tax=Arthrobacter burdickii TaxID=3035920 RepID=A0ABT8K0B2_9MICC|nr:hypothetical protein [Arthrobacter burdickii]MDN4610647.1 hypothetical protein [Arthrobacter burdickii]